MLAAGAGAETLTDRAREKVFWGLLALELMLFLGWQLSHLDGFQWGSDEGTYLMRVRLLQQGHRLYTEIWTDQMPGLIELLRVAFALFGASVQIGRAVVVLLAALGLLCTAALTRQLAGRSGALAVAPILAVAPNFFWLSRAMVSPDLPSISLGVAGLVAVGQYIRTRRRGWLVLSGVAFAGGLYVKATAALAVVPAALWLAIDLWRKEGRSLGTLLRRMLMWGASALMPFGLALCLHDLPGLWNQFVGAQVASGQMALKIGPHAAKILAYLGDDNWGLASLALAGTLVALRCRREAALVGLALLGTSLVVLLLRSPLWPSHHLIVLLFPMGVLAGVGLSGLWRSIRRRRLDVGGLLAVGALVVYAGSVPGIIGSDSELIAARTSQSSLEAVGFLKRRFPEGTVVISDYQMIPFLAGCSVPPELATVSKKRMQLGMLGSDDLIRITQESKPEAVLLWDEQLSRASEYVRWLRERYVLAFKWNYHEIRVSTQGEGVQHTQEATLGEAVRLRGYDLRASAVDPGGVLEVGLYWEVLAPITRRYHGFVHLLTPDGLRVTQRDHLAWGEQYPSTDWHVGETIYDCYQLDVPADATPGRHLLSVGLYDQETKRRAVVRAPDGRRVQGDQVTLAVRPVVRWPPQYAAPPLKHRLNTRLGEVARLVGYGLEEKGERLEVQLVWMGLTAPEWPEYVVFVHLRDDAGLVAQHDGVPASGKRPTPAWRTGEFVTDVHVVPLKGVGRGEYGLFVGMYDPATGQRIPAYDAAGGLLPSGEVCLGRVSIGDRR